MKWLKHVLVEITVGEKEKHVFSWVNKEFALFISNSLCIIVVFFLSIPSLFYAYTLPLNVDMENTDMRKERKKQS